MRPQIPGLSPGGLGPHHTSSGFPAGFPPVSRLPAGFFPFVRLPLVSLRPAFSGCSLRPLPGSGSPSVSLRVPFPLSNLHVSAAAARFRRRWSRAAGTKVISSAATTSPGSRDPPALQMGSGWPRWDLATGSPVTSGRRAHDSPRPNRPDWADLVRLRDVLPCVRDQNSACLVHEPAVDVRHSPQARRRGARTRLRPLGQALSYASRIVPRVPHCPRSWRDVPVTAIPGGCQGLLRDLPCTRHSKKASPVIGRGL